MLFKRLLPLVALYISAALPAHSQGMSYVTKPAARAGNIPPAVVAQLENALQSAAQKTLTGVFRPVAQAYQLPATPAGSWLSKRVERYANFTPANKPQEIFLDSVNGTQLIRPLAKQRIQYTAAGEILVDSTFKYVSSTSSYVFYSVVQNTYVNQLLAETRNRTIENGVESESITQYTRDANGNIIRALVSLVSVTGPNPFSNILISYNTQNLPIQIDLQLRDFQQVGVVWVTLQRQLLTYSATNKPVAILTKLSSDGTLEDFQRQIIAYTSFDEPARIETEFNDAGIWFRALQIIFAYDADNNQISQTTRKYTDPTGTTLEDAERYQTTYQRVLSTAAAKALQAQLSVVPNPAAGAATVSYRLPAAATTSLEVLDLTGRRVAEVLPATAQPAGAHSLALPVNTLRAGLYVVQLRAGQQTQLLKLQVQ